MCYGALRTEKQMQNSGLDHDTLQMLLATLESFGKRRLPLEVRLALDEKSEFPEQLVRELLGPEIGLHLLFIPEEHGGLGGGAYDVYRVSEVMARLDLGVATAFLAIFLGTDPIVAGATPEQKSKWMRRIAEEGLIVAYGVTEPLAGSEVSAIRTRAERIEEDGAVRAYKLNGAKQFITNGGHAQLFSILASAPTTEPKPMTAAGSTNALGSMGARVAVAAAVLASGTGTGAGPGAGGCRADGPGALKMRLFSRARSAKFTMPSPVRSTSASALNSADLRRARSVKFTTPLLSKSGSAALP
jgi:alkylation response protein AidB-like acyl-CoA dehydrogenase